ncbi:hypothetical protein DFH11DRAFT_1725742 [Phellopilus nigrolimitatus]|nr:hypothetical protein DFH11DRAFT_1725742 [Phellopilus nigrolimitatus]
MLRKPKSKGKAAGGRKMKQPVQFRPHEERAEEDSDANYSEKDRNREDENEQKLKSSALKAMPILEDPNFDPDDPILTVPRARYNAMLAVLRNTLYIYAGILEFDPREYTLDDFYALPLDKLDQFDHLLPASQATQHYPQNVLRFPSRLI